MAAPSPRLAIRDRLRALLPSSSPSAADDEEPAGRRGLAMLLSVVVAVVMWFSFSMRETYPLTLRLPVEIVRTPSGRALSAPPPSVATVTVQGEGWTLLSLMRDLPSIRVVAETGTVDLGAALQESGLPAGVQLQSVQPLVVDLALDTRTQRRLPIRLRQRIDVVSPFDLLRPPILRPDSVTVTGAQSLLGELQDWPTDMFVAEGVDAPLVRRIALADTFGGLLSPSVREITVRLDVGEYTEGERMLDVEVDNLPPDVAGVRFSPARVQARFRVPLEGPAYNQAENTTAFRAVVDWFDIARVARDSMGGLVPVSPRWPPGLDLRDVTISPSRVEYFIRRPAQEEPAVAPED